MAWKMTQWTCHTHKITTQTQIHIIHTALTNVFHEHCAWAHRDAPTTSPPEPCAPAWAHSMASGAPNALQNVARRPPILPHCHSTASDQSEDRQPHSLPSPAPHSMLRSSQSYCPDANPKQQNNRNQMENREGTRYFLSHCFRFPLNQSISICHCLSFVLTLWTRQGVSSGTVSSWAATSSATSTLTRRQSDSSIYTSLLCVALPVSGA